MTEENFTAPLLDNLKYGFRIGWKYYTKIYTKATRQALDELFEEVKKISPVHVKKSREIFCIVDRGPIEDYDDYDRIADYFSYSEFLQDWKEYYPDEKKWFSFIFIDNIETGVRGILVDNYLVLFTSSKPESKNFPINMEAFVRWLTGKVRECITDIQSGIYNERVRKELPAHLRFGTISCKNYWDIYPEEKKYYERWLEKNHKNLTEQDKIRVIPEGIVWERLGCLEPDLLVLSSLPRNDREKIASKCDWEEIPELTLLTEKIKTNEG